MTRASMYQAISAIALLEKKKASQRKPSMDWRLKNLMVRAMASV